MPQLLPAMRNTPSTPSVVCTSSVRIVRTYQSNQSRHILENPEVPFLNSTARCYLHKGVELRDAMPLCRSKSWCSSALIVFPQDPGFSVRLLKISKRDGSHPDFQEPEMPPVSQLGYACSAGLASISARVSVVG